MLADVMKIIVVEYSDPDWPSSEIDILFFREFPIILGVTVNQQPEVLGEEVSFWELRPQVSCD